MGKLKLSNKREAFTLVEVLAVVVILGILTLITYPILNGIIDKNKQKLYDEQMENLMIGSRTWIVQNGGKLQRVHGYVYRLSFEEMYKSGMIDSMNPKNPKTGRDLTGCMQLLYRRDIEGFDITYDESCDGTLGPVVIDEPKVDLTVDAGIINSNGWAKEDFYVKVVGEYLVNHTYCVDKEECTPYITGKGNSNNILINTEGTTYVCINGTNELETTDTVCKSYKLDKTNPIVGKIVLSGTSGLNDWFVSDVSVSYTASTDALSGIDTNVLSPSETVITTDTEGTTYTLTATDKAGNTSSTSYTVKVDKTGPNVGSLTFDGTLVEGWYTSDVTVNIVNGTDDMSGHLVTTSDVAKVTENTDNKVITVTSYDNAGNSSSNTYTIKVDKTGPVILDKYVAYNLYPTNTQTGVNQLTISNNLFSTTGTDGYMYYTGLKLTDTSKVIITLGTPLDSDTTFQVYYLTSGLTFTDANSVKYHAKKGETYIELDLPGLDYDTLRIDFGDVSNKTYNISSIDIVTETYISDESYIHANIKDELSGVKSYDVNSTGWKDIEVSPTYHMRYEVVTSGTYTINVKDKAGNTNSEVINNNNADTTAPTKPTIDYDGSWINTDFSIKLSTIEDETGVSYWRYSLDGQVYDNYEDSASLTFETPLFTDEGEYKVYFMACDRAGNCSEPNSTYIRLDKTKPVIGEFVINGEAGLNGWYVSDVEVTVTDSYDDLSQIDTVTLTPDDTTITEDTEGITYTLTATDKAGNSVTYDHIVKVDKTDPTAGTATFSGTIGNNDWYTSDVIATLTNGSDITSGHLSTTIDFETINFDTKGQVVTVKTVDNAGNESTREYTIKRDASGPLLGQLEFSGSLGLNDWYVSDVEVGYDEIIDDISGIASEVLTPNNKLTVDTDGITYTLTATDNAGNTSSISQTIKRDTEKPSLGVVTINGTKGTNDWYTSDVTFSLADGTDTLSGFFMNVIDIDQITENTDGTTVTYTALDNAGNENSQEYVIKIDKTAPTVTIANSTSNGNIILTGTVNPTESLSGYNYQWYTNGSAVSGATSNTLTIDSAGTHKLKVTTNAGNESYSNEISSYTVTYNLNGGTGTFAKQIKVSGESVTIPTNAPAKSGYTFKGWGTSSTDTTVDYEAGDTYSADANIELYAIWQSNSLVSLLLEQYKSGNTTGLVQDTSNTNIYYYKGTKDQVANNYIWYGGHQWQVIEIDKTNKTITMITSQPLTIIAPASSVWTTAAGYNSSYVNTWLNTYFYGTLPSSVQSNIVSSTFNIGIYSNPTNLTTTQKIGLLDVNQFARAGDNSFLYANDTYLMGHRYDSTRATYVVSGSSDSAGVDDVSRPEGIRPVMKISDVVVYGGTGTLTDSYRASASNTNTSNVIPGEYISVPTTGSECGTDKMCLFRVVSKDSDSVKVVLNGLLSAESDYNTNNTSSDASITTSHLIYTPLNSFANSISSTYRYTGNKTFYKGDYPAGSNYTAVKDETLSSSVGLPTVGELFSGNDIDLSSSTTKYFVDVNTIENPTIGTYFMMNRSTGTYIWVTASGGQFNQSDAMIGEGVRPVIFLKLGTTSALTFTGGVGTAQDPYILSGS